jgi:hypothetical protein
MSSIWESSQLALLRGGSTGSHVTASKVTGNKVTGSDVTGGLEICSAHARLFPALFSLLE